MWASKHFGQESNEYLAAAFSAAATIPVVAIPYVFIASLLPDGDGNGSVTKNWLLAPGFWIFGFFVSHRGFTHRIEGIAAFGALCWFLSKFQPTKEAVAIGTLVSLTVLWTVFERNYVRTILSAVMIAFAPVLTVQAYWNAFLIAIFVGYVTHMLGDVLTSEGWTIAKLGSRRIHFQLPIAFDAGGWFEKAVVYPILFAAIAYFVFGEADFWKAKMLQE